MKKKKPEAPLSDASSLLQNKLAQCLIAHNIDENDSNSIASEIFRNLDVVSMIRTIPAMSEINENATMEKIQKYRSFLKKAIQKAIHQYKKNKKKS